MSDTVIKKCRTCGQEKPISQFWYNPKTKDRVKPSCIDCCKEYNKHHYENNRQKRINQVKEYQRNRNFKGSPTIVNKYLNP